jgi:hypothetical protein
MAPEEECQHEMFVLILNRPGIPGGSDS